jgi:hypothetical protein
VKLTPYTKAALAALCIGVGVALFASAVADIRKPPCVGCEDDAEKAIEAVAEASAELLKEPNGDD